MKRKYGIILKISDIVWRVAGYVYIIFAQHLGKSHSIWHLIYRKYIGEADIYGEGWSDMFSVKRQVRRNLSLKLDKNAEENPYTELTLLNAANLNPS